MQKKSGLIFKSPVATVSQTPNLGSFIMSMASSAIVLCTHRSSILIVFIRIHVIHPTPQLVQLINIISNLIFHCNHCYANTVFITIHDSTAAVSSGPSGLLNATFTFKGRPPPIIFTRIVRPMNALQLCPWQFSHRCWGWGATSENRSKIGDFTPTRSLWSKISGTRGCPHQ